MTVGTEEVKEEKEVAEEGRGEVEIRGIKIVAARDLKEVIVNHTMYSNSIPLNINILSSSD